MLMASPVFTIPPVVFAAVVVVLSSVCVFLSAFATSPVLSDGVSGVVSEGASVVSEGAAEVDAVVGSDWDVGVVAEEDGVVALVVGVVSGELLI